MRKGEGCDKHEDFSGDTVQRQRHNEVYSHASNSLRNPVRRSENGTGATDYLKVECAVVG